MPLIMDLRNPAMRERHWKQLMEEVGKTFDPHADTFTLELVLDLGRPDAFDHVLARLDALLSEHL